MGYTQELAINMRKKIFLERIREKIEQPISKSEAKLLTSQLAKYSKRKEPLPINTINMLLRRMINGRTGSIQILQDQRIQVTFIKEKPRTFLLPEEISVTQIKEILESYKKIPMVAIPREAIPLEEAALPPEEEP